MTKRRSCPCVLVDDDTLIDCGSGALKNLRLIDVDLAAIETVLISHLHADHIADLVSLLWAMQLDGRTAALMTTGPFEVRESVSTLLEVLNTPEGSLTYSIHYRELTGGESLAGFSTCVIVYRPATLAYRIDRGGRNVCYSGDTMPSDDLVKLARSTSLLIYEAVFLEGEKEAAARTCHSTGSDAGKVAERAGAEKLVLFHISRRSDEDEQVAQRQ